MVSKYRDVIDIVAQILQSAGHGISVTRTQIMYEVFLSFEELRRYLFLLTEEGLLADHGNGYQQLYKVTEKGIRFLKICDETGEYVSAAIKEEDSISDNRLAIAWS